MQQMASPVDTSSDLHNTLFTSPRGPPSANGFTPRSHSLGSCSPSPLSFSNHMSHSCLWGACRSLVNALPCSPLHRRAVGSCVALLSLTPCLSPWLQQNLARTQHRPAVATGKCHCVLLEHVALRL
jgi:hypothetical protein